MAEKLTAPQERDLAVLNIVMCKEIIKEIDNTEAKYIIGIDPSQSATGISILDMEGNLIECFETDIKKTSDQAALKQFYKVFADLFAKYPPAVLAWEQVAVDTQFTGLRALLYIEATMLLAIGQFAEQENRRLPLLVSVSVGGVKKYATGKGQLFREIENKAIKRKMAKQAVKDGVLSQWGHSFATDNQADAFCISKMGQGVYSSAKAWDRVAQDFTSKPKLIEHLRPFQDAQTYHKECVYAVLCGKGILDDNDYASYKKRIEKIRNQS